MSENSMKEMFIKHVFDDLILLPNGSAITFENFYEIFKNAKDLDEMIAINESENRGYESILEV